MKSSTNPNILVVLAKAGQQKGLLQHLENGFGPVRVLHNPSLADLRQTMSENPPKVLLCGLGSSPATVLQISKLIASLKLSSHIVAMAPSVSTRAVIKAMGQGAHDLISEEDPLHLQLVVARELGILQAWCERNAVQLAPFVEDEEGHATLDGVRIVSCDSAFAGIIGAVSAKVLENTSLLQYVSGDDHHALKQLIHRCLQGDTVTEPVPIHGFRLDGTQKILLITLTATYQDDRAQVLLAVRAAIPGSDVDSIRDATRSAAPLNPAVTKRIQSALKQNQLALVVQPISELAGESKRQPSSKLDIYVMIKDPEGELPAGKFIHEARASGLIRFIDRWVIHNACAALRTNFQKHGPVLLFLRLSRQTLHDPTLVHTLKREIQEQGVAADSLSFELFESDAIDLTQDEIKVLHEIKEAGFLLSISRYGASRESTNLLQRLPVDFVKLEPTLAEKVQHSENARKFVQEMIQMANVNGHGVISTHVPNATAMATLWTLGVHYVQGNYLQEPEIVLRDPNG